MVERKRIPTELAAQRFVAQVSQMFSSAEWTTYLERNQRQFTDIAAQAVAMSVQASTQKILSKHADMEVVSRQYAKALEAPITLVVQNAAGLQKQLNHAAEIAMTQIHAFEQNRKISVEQLTLDLSKIAPALSVLGEVAAAATESGGNIYNETGGGIRVRVMTTGEDSVGPRESAERTQYVSLTGNQIVAIVASFVLLPELLAVGLTGGQQFSDLPYGALILQMWELSAEKLLPILITWGAASKSSTGE